MRHLRHRFEEAARIGRRRRDMRLPGIWRGESWPRAQHRLSGDFERFVDEFFGRTHTPARRGEGQETAFIPEIDVIEHENDYLVKAELPGLTSDDVEVSIVGDALEIRGEKKIEKEEKKENYYYSERGYGSFLRTVPLPAKVDADRIEARLEKGVLEIFVPKSEALKAKKIAVKAEAGAPRGAEAARPREERAREKH
jgi:HSP20 family protein